jgi:hypothetical protein
MNFIKKLKKNQPSIKIIYAKILLQRRNHVVEPGNGFSVPEIRVVGSYLKFY